VRRPRAERGDEPARELLAERLLETLAGRTPGRLVEARELRQQQVGSALHPTDVIDRPRDAA